MGQIISCEAQLENPNPALYSEGLWEEAKGQCSFHRSSQAAVIFRFTYGLSAISAFLIIHLVLKSSTRLSSIYHRIMFGMSICEMIASISAALTTLPMPAPGDYWTDIVNIQSTRLGNTFTCTLQGFLIRFGDITSGFYFLLGLNFYYACAIGFQMKIETLTKYIEPLIHIICISVGLLTSLPPLLVGGYNVSYDTMYCAVAPKPWFCNHQNSTVTCVRGEVGMGQELLTDKRIISQFGLSCLLTILLCLLIVCCRVYKKDREMATMIRDWEIHHDGKWNLSNSHQLSRPVKSIRLRWGVYHFMNAGHSISVDEIRKRIKDQYKDTKVIISQVALYFAMAIIQSTCRLCSYQGFLQLFIFIFHKVFNLRRHHPDISISDAILETFKGTSLNEAFIMSGIYIVKRDNKAMDSSVRSIHWEDSESTPLVTSHASVSANFGSEALSTMKQSLPSFNMFLGVDGNSNTQSNYTNDDELSKCFEESRAGLSGFSEVVEDGNQQSFGELHEDGMSEGSSISSW